MQTMEAQMQRALELEHEQKMKEREEKEKLLESTSEKIMQKKPR